MSIALTSQVRSFKKIMPIVVASALLVAALGYIAMSTATVHAAQPKDFGLHEGQRITSYNADGNPDINVVNENFRNAYARNFINPATCLFYGSQYGPGGCFAAGLTQVSTATRQAFPLSCYFTDGETKDGKVYYRETTGKDTATLHHVAVDGPTAAAFDADFFLKVFTVNTLEKNFYQMGSEYTSMTQVPACISMETTGTPLPTGNVTVSLASDNPAAGTLVDEQAAADLAHFMFSGNGTVTSLKFKRIGVSADSDLSSVYLYDGARRLTDSAAVSNGEITFNDPTGLFTVAGSKNISVKADLIGANTGITVGVQLISFNGNSTSISGNLFTVATGTLAGVTLTDNTDPALNATLNPENDTIVWRQTAAVTQRYVWLKSLQLRVIGSVLPGDLRNFRLYLSGVQIGSAVAQVESNGYIVFDFTSAPVKLDTGNRELKILTDVIGGSGRNFTVSFRQASDLQVVDSQYNAGVFPTCSGTSCAFPSDSGLQTIAAGVLTITTQQNSPSGDIVKDSAGAVLARFELKASGESMKVENLRVNFNESSNSVNELRNGALFADGVQIGSTQDIQEVANADALLLTYTQYSLGSSLVVVPGTPRILEIRADIADGDGTDSMAAAQTITASLVVGASNVQRLTSLDYVNSSAKDGNQLTVRTGSFTAGKYSGFSDQSVVDPSTNIKLGHFTLIAASSETVNVNTINIDSDTSGGTFDMADITDMYIKVFNDTGTLIYTSPVKATPSVTASNSYSTNFSLPVNKTYKIEVYGNVLSGVTAGQYMNLEMDATGITANSSTSVATGEADGQRITDQAAVLSVNNGSIAAATLARNDTVLPAYSFTLQPAYDNFTLDEIYVDLSSTLASSTGAVASLILKEGTLEIGSATVNTTTSSASFTGLNRTINSADGTKTYTVDVHLANVTAGGQDTAGVVAVRLDGLKYRDSAGTPTTINGFVPANYTGNNIVLHAAYPMFTNQTLPTTILGPGSQTLFKTAVTSAGGNVSLRRLVFTVTKTVNVTMADDTFVVFEDGSDITSSGAIATATLDLGLAPAGAGTVTFTLTGERTMNGHTYELRATIAGTIASGASVVTKIANPSTTSAIGATTATAAQNAGASIVWSDFSAVSHATTTTDWMGDYLVKTINVSQSLFAGI